MGLKVALTKSIRKGRREMVECLIEQLEKFIPYYNNQINLYVAVEAEKLPILKYLTKHHHSSYTIEDYGVENARVLQEFLQKSNLPELYRQIIRV